MRNCRRRGLEDACSAGEYAKTVTATAKIREYDSFLKMSMAVVDLLKVVSHAISERWLVCYALSSWEAGSVVVDS